MARRPTPPPQPLIVSEDPWLVEELLPVVGALGAEPFVAASAPAARAHWTSAPVVLVGADLVGALAQAHLAQRSRVYVLARADAGPDEHRLWAQAVGLGAEQVGVLPEATAWLTTAVADAIEGRADGLLLAVVGGRGGAGATTLVAAMASRAAARRQSVVAIDLDPLGGGLDLVFGAESTEGLRWSQLVGARGRVAASTLTGMLPSAHGVAVVSCDRLPGDRLPAEAVNSIVDAALHGSDLVVADVPRCLDTPGRAVVQRADATLLVVPAELRAASAATRVAAALTAHTDRVSVVVRGPSPGGLSGQAVADALHLPLAGEMRAEPGCAARLERGIGPARGRGPLATFCAGFLDGLRPSLREQAA